MLEFLFTLLLSSFVEMPYTNTVPTDNTTTALQMNLQNSMGNDVIALFPYRLM